MPLMVRGALPVLFRLKVWAALVVPRFWLLKARLAVVILAEGALPLPLRLTVCGLPPALSAMLTEVVRFPMVAGVNAARIVQLAFTATELPQVSVTVKSPGFAPAAPRLVMVRVVLPVLVRVTDCVALVVPRLWPAKVSAPGARVTTAPLPVPVSAAVCGLLKRLSAMVTQAVRVPSAAGENATLIVQLALGDREPSQPFVSEKSPALAPPTAMLEMAKVAVPAFVRIMFRGELSVPILWAGKIKLEGETVTWPESPEPVRVAVWGLPTALSLTVREAVRAKLPRGENVTVMVQLPFGDTVVPQVVLSAKSEGLAPARAIPATVRDMLPVLVKVITCAALVVPWV